MAFWCTCSRCGKFINADGMEHNVMVSMTPTFESTQMVLCESCKKSFDEWIHDKPHSGRYKCFCVNETPVFADDLVFRPTGCERTPRVYIGSVHPLPVSNLDDKEFPKKMLEEAAEVYSAWEDYVEAEAKEDDEEAMNRLRHLAYECGDVIQTCANMLSAVQKAAQEIRPTFYRYNVYDASELMSDIERRNREKGRYDV